MATKLFLRNTTVNGITDTGDGVVYDLITTAGAGSDTGVVNTVAGGTDVHWTKTAGGLTMAWITGRVPAGGFTLTSADISAWLHESATQANARGRVHIYRYQPGTPTITELGGSPFNDDKTELSTSTTEDTWTANVTDTAFSENDRLLVKFYITNNGTMPSGRTATITFNAADGASGDSFVNIAETVAFKAESVNTTITPAGANLALSSAAPTVGLSANAAIIPPQGDVVLSSVAPDVLASVHVTIIPASGNVALSSVAPTVATSSHVTSQPNAAQALLNNWIVDETGDPILDENDEPILDAAANAPVVVQTTNTQILPAAADLVLSTTAPAIAESDHLSVSPAAADLVLTTAAPTVAVSDSFSIAPPFAELVLSSTVPAVAATAHKNAAPAGADLALSALAPTVAVAPTGVSFSPAAAQALLNNWIVDENGDPVLDENNDPILDAAANAPSVGQTNNVAVSPSAGHLLLSSVAPTVSATGQDTVVSPASANLTLSSTASAVAVAFPALEVVGGGGGQPFRRRLPRKPPQRVIQRPPPVPVPVLLVPPSANLVLSSTAPTASVSNHLSVTPAAAGLTRLATAPVLIQTVGEHLTAEELLILAEAA